MPIPRHVGDACRGRGNAARSHGHSAASANTAAANGLKLAKSSCAIPSSDRSTWTFEAMQLPCERGLPLNICTCSLRGRRAKPTSPPNGLRPTAQCAACRSAADSLAASPRFRSGRIRTVKTRDAPASNP
jgi:hypothetical protein